MLRTQDLPPAQLAIGQVAAPPAPEGVPPRSLEDQGLVIIGAGQVLGGAIIEAMRGDKIVVNHCWSVSDLTDAHWAGLLGGRDGAVAMVVPAQVSDAIRSSMERFHADGARRIQAEGDRRAGVLDAVRALGSTFQTATLQAAAAAGAARSGGPHGAGNG